MCFSCAGTSLDHVLSLFVGLVILYGSKRGNSRKSLDFCPSELNIPEIFLRISEFAKIPVQSKPEWKCLYVYVSLRKIISLSLYISVFVLVCASVCVSVCEFVCTSGCVSVRASIYMIISGSVRLSK